MIYLKKNMSKIILYKAFNCSFDYRVCFEQALEDEKRNEEKFFQDYSHNKPLGWPQYERVARAYIESKELICSGQILKNYIDRPIDNFIDMSE